MDIKDQKNTWDGFVKLSIIGASVVIAVLVLMAFFLI